MRWMLIVFALVMSAGTVMAQDCTPKIWMNGGKVYAKADDANPCFEVSFTFEEKPYVITGCGTGMTSLDTNVPEGQSLVHLFKDISCVRRPYPAFDMFHDDRSPQQTGGTQPAKAAAPAGPGREYFLSYSTEQHGERQWFEPSGDCGFVVHLEGTGSRPFTVVSQPIMAQWITQIKNQSDLLAVDFDRNVTFTHSSRGAKSFNGTLVYYNPGEAEQLATALKNWARSCGAKLP